MRAWEHFPATGRGQASVLEVATWAQEQDFAEALGADFPTVPEREVLPATPTQGPVLETMAQNPGVCLQMQPVRASRKEMLQALRESHLLPVELWRAEESPFETGRGRELFSRTALVSELGMTRQRGVGLRSTMLWQERFGKHLGGSSWGWVERRRQCAGKPEWGACLQGGSSLGLNWRSKNRIGVIMA